MRDFATLTPRGQTRRLRALARDALRQFGVDPPDPRQPARLSLLGNWENATFKVEPLTGPFAGQRLLLRLHRPGHQRRDTIASELLWLDALRRDAGLQVQRPIATPDGRAIIEADAPGLPAPRLCTLMHWIDGRFARKARPHHLHQVGALTAILHNHAQAWTPPPAFVRDRWDPPRLFDPVLWNLLPLEHRPLFQSLAERATEAMEQLAQDPQTFGLIHADLHMGNVLFHEGLIIPIDFDDCGFAPHLYDLATSLTAYRLNPHLPALREALLAGYARHRALPDLQHLDLLGAARRLSLLIWSSSRALDNPAFLPILPKITAAAISAAQDIIGRPSP